MPTKKKLKTVSLDNMIDKHLGKLGTKARDIFEQELQLEKFYSTHFQSYSIGMEGNK